VLVGVRSGCDEHIALDAAIETAKRRSAHLVVVHVVATTPSAAVAVPSAAGAVALTGEELADRCHIDCELALAGTDLEWSFEIRAGDAARGLARAAQDHMAACIVVGRHAHRTPVGRYRCTAIRVAEISRQPVLIVPPPDPVVEPFDGPPTGT
jgi:nucleotide-binding universal stress UspA family protein